MKQLDTHNSNIEMAKSIMVINLYQHNSDNDLIQFHFWILLKSLKMKKKISVLI